MAGRVEKKARELFVSGLHMSKYDLVEKAYCDPRTAWVVLNRLNAEKFVYVVSWRRVKCASIPVYCLGGIANRPKPKPLTQAQKNRKRLCDPEYMIREMMRKRAKRIIEKVRV